jgi:hypothetical protein
MIADPDLGQIVQPHILADPAMVADLQTPGKLDADAGLDRYALADASPERSQDKDAQARTPERWNQEDGLRQEP